LFLREHHVAISIRVGDSWLGESNAPHARWVENAGDSAVFPDGATATAYAAARGVTFTTMQVTVSGRKNQSKKTNND
jgi:hypothetical protein